MILRPRLAIGAIPNRLLAVLAGMIYGGLNLASLQFAALDGGGTLTYIWPGTSWLCVCLLVLPDGRSRLLSIVVAAISDCLLQSYHFNSIATGAAVWSIGLVGPITAWLGLHYRERLRFELVEDQLAFVAIAVFASAASAMAGTLWARFNNELSLGYVAQWFQAELLGLLVLLPSLIVIVSEEERRRRVVGNVEAFALPAAACVMTVCILMTSHSEFLILVMPILTAISFRLGSVYSASTTLLITLTALVCAKFGLEQESQGVPYHLTHIVFIQAFIAVSFLSSVPAALAITEQARLRERLLEEQDKAQKARRAAEIASAAKSDFVSTMSHELRSPLNAVIGFAQLLSERPELQDEVQRDVARIKSASDTLLVVINDILEFSALEQRGVRLEPAVFSIGDLTAATVAILEGGAQKKSLELSFACDPELAALSVIGDASRLRQILLNLVSNAIKFTDTGRVQLNVKKLQATETDTVALRFEVADTGPGIEQDHIPLLFQRFSQLDNTRNRNHGGSGLGLAICKQLVEAMNGRIGVLSEPGEGSVFWFEVALPRGDTASLEAVPGTTEPITGDASVLVVDDLELNRDIAEAMLQKSGYRVQAVSSGVEAVSSVSRGNFDLVLMDIQMPGMDGFEAARQIRLATSKGSIPIVAMTANVAPDEIARCLAAGMNAHIGKPFQHSALISTIEAQLAAHRAQQDGHQRRSTAELPAI